MKPGGQKPALSLVDGPCWVCQEESDREGGSALNLCNGRRIHAYHAAHGGAIAEIEHETVIVRPGDTLIVRVSPTTSRANIEHLAASLRANKPEGLRGIIIAAEQLAVLEGGAPA